MGHIPQLLGVYEREVSALPMTGVIGGIVVVSIILVEV